MCATFYTIFRIDPLGYVLTSIPHFMYVIDNSGQVLVQISKSENCTVTSKSRQTRGESKNLKTFCNSKFSLNQVWQKL